MRRNESNASNSSNSGNPTYNTEMSISKRKISYKQSIKNTKHLQSLSKTEVNHTLPHNPTEGDILQKKTKVNKVHTAADLSSGEEDKSDQENLVSFENNNPIVFAKEKQEVMIKQR